MMFMIYRPARENSQAGRKKGHKGSRRQRPQRIDRAVEHRADSCPDCEGKLKKCSGTRQRVVEDIPESVRVETVKHIIHRDWCPNCRKVVEPLVTEALPRASVGNGIVVLSGWTHSKGPYSNNRIKNIKTNYLNSIWTGPPALDTSSFVYPNFSYNNIVS